MEDYKTMYHKLFNKITDIIGDLQAVQQEAEEYYLSHPPKQEADILPIKIKQAE